MRQFFIPNHKNSFTPHLVSHKAIVFYILVVSLINFLFLILGVGKSSANINSESLLELHNKERIKLNIPVLSYNAKLSESATQKALDMLASNCWSHYCPDGRSPWEYFKNAGYVYLHGGENLAEGFKNNDSMVTAWMNSPTHKDNILNLNFTEVGFGFAYGEYQGKKNNIVVVVHFGTPTNSVFKASEPVRIIDDLPLITSPENFSYLNTSNITLKGKSFANTYLDILSGGNNLIGRVDANDGAFSFSAEFSEGSHSLSLNAYDKNTNTYIANYENHILNVDTTKPEAYFSNVTAGAINDQISITFETSNDILDSITTRSDLKFSNPRTGFVNIKFSKDILSELGDIPITLKDFAGNTQTVFLTKEIYSKAIELDLENVSNFSFLNFFNIDDFKFPGIREAITLMFALYLFIILGIDIAVLIKTDMLHKVSRKPHLQFSLIALLLILLNVGGISGNILTGFKL